jgi:metal-dependent amidase/aminoacylase/carboxypeptidase family protein
MPPMPHEAVDTTLAPAISWWRCNRSWRATSTRWVGGGVGHRHVSHRQRGLNVIPHQVVLGARCARWTPPCAIWPRRGSSALIGATASAYGAVAQVDYQRGYPVTMNTPEDTDFAADAAEEVAGR